MPDHVKRKVTSKSSIVDALVDTSASFLQGVVEMRRTQQGFDSASARIADAMSSLVPVLREFVDGGGTVMDNGVTGGVYDAVTTDEAREFTDTVSDKLQNLIDVARESERPEDAAKMADRIADSFKEAVESLSINVEAPNVSVSPVLEGQRFDGVPTVDVERLSGLIGKSVGDAVSEALGGAASDVAPHGSESASPQSPETSGKPATVSEAISASAQLAAQSADAAQPRQAASARQVTGGASGRPSGTDEELIIEFLSERFPKNFGERVAEAQEEAGRKFDATAEALEKMGVPDEEVEQRRASEMKKAYLDAARQLASEAGVSSSRSEVNLKGQNANAATGLEPEEPEGLVERLNAALDRRAGKDEPFADSGEGGVANAMRGVSGALSGLGRGNMGQVVSSLEGIGGTVGGIASLLGRVATPVTAGVGVAQQVLDLVGQGVDVLQSQQSTAANVTGENNPVSGLAINAQNAIDDKWTAFTTGNSEQDMQAARDALLSARTGYGTDQYREGYEFAANAMSRYGVSARDATNLYVNSVVRAGNSMSDLEETMEKLQETVQDTGQTMSDTVKQYEANVSGWTRLGLTQAGAETVQDQVTATGGEYAQDASAGLQRAASMYEEYDPIRMQTAAEMTKQGYSQEQAYALAPLEMLTDDRYAGKQTGQVGTLLLNTRLDEFGGETLLQLAKEYAGDDKDGEEKLASVFKAISEGQVTEGAYGRYARNGYGYPAMVQLASELSNWASDEDKKRVNPSDPESLANVLFKLFSATGEMEDDAEENSSGGAVADDAYGDSFDSFKDENVNRTGTGDGPLSMFTESVGNELNERASGSKGSFGDGELSSKSKQGTVALLSQAGLVSDRFGRSIGDREAGNLTNDLFDAYRKDGDRGSESFVNWVRDSDNKSDVDSVLQKYRKYEDGDGGDGSGKSGNDSEQVDVKISFAEGLDKLFDYQIERYNREKSNNGG